MGKSEELNAKINDLDKRAKRLESEHETLKDREDRKWKFIKWFCSIVTGILIIVLFTSIFRPNNYRDSINGIEVNSIDKMKQYDSLFIESIKDEIKIEIFKYDTLNKLKPNDATSTAELQKKLISRIENRNDNYIKEIEKEKSRLMKNVVIINLVARYIVIICCIIAFVLIFRAFAGSKSKDDIFE